MDKTNYIFSSRNITNPKPKLFGESLYKKQIIERDGTIFTVWNRDMSKSYLLWLCYKTTKKKFTLKKYKYIK